MQITSWQQPQWQRVLKSLASNSLAHAYLLTGIAGLAKSDFAEYMAKRLLCSDHDASEPCEFCKNCQLVVAGNHPDLKTLMPEEKGKAIKIDQIRQLANFVNQTPQVSERKVIIINPAEAMNIAAANSLLKTLEEPAGNTVILLVSHQAGKLLPTIRSRCQLIQFTPPSHEEALRWLTTKSDCATSALPSLLKLANGAPLSALNMANSEELEKRKQWFDQWLSWQNKRLTFSALVKAWVADDLSRVLFHLNSWVQDLLRLAVSSSAEYFVNEDFTQTLQRLGAGFNAHYLAQYLEFLQKKTRLITGPISVNKQLVLEEILIKWISFIQMQKRLQHVS
jgi:DNA polymerase-3 subunit delta'